MASGEIVITEAHCKGCSYCARWCARGCIEMNTGKRTALGLPIAEFKHPEKCNACGICAWMCMGMAIEVYKVEKPAAAQASSR